MGFAREQRMASAHFLAQYECKFKACIFCGFSTTTALPLFDLAHCAKSYIFVIKSQKHALYFLDFEF